MKQKTLVLVAIAILAIFATSCFDIEQSLVLNKDLSGKAGFRMGVDFEPMVLTMLQMQRSMEGKKGAPSAEEIAKAKADFLAQQKKETKTDDSAADRKALEAKLPPGVKLLDQTVTDSGMKLTTNILFGFQDLKSLADITFPKKEGAQPSDKGVIDKPFDGLQVKDEGRTLVIRTKPADPVSGVEKGAKEQAEGGPDNKEMEAMMRDALKGLRVAFKIQAPFKVLETNAMRREGNTLIWEYTLDTLEKMEKQGKTADAGVFVRYQK